MERFFTEAFEKMNDTDRESFYRTIFMQDTSEYAAKLREAYYRTKLKHMGENVRIGAGVKIVNPEYISLGDNVTICDGVTLIARGPGGGPDGEPCGITIGSHVTLNDRVYLDTERADEGYIVIGDHVYIGTGTTLFGHVGLEIGEHVLMAQNITLTPYSHIFEDPARPIIEQGGHTRKVTIGRDVYVGMDVTIMYTGDIGEGSVIGSGSVVVKPIPPYSVAVGCPAKVIRKRGE
ncbi:MAG: acyltransferase [Oscillospiraceae bacterium]|nr:acyltransferase [Oscillospiraceae bacterium]